MAKHDRQIDDFPHSRSNAEHLIELYADLHRKEYRLLDFIHSFPSSPERDALFFGDRELVELTYTHFKELITNTFPELLPLPWES